METFYRVETYRKHSETWNRHTAWEFKTLAEAKEYIATFPPKTIARIVEVTTRVVIIDWEIVETHNGEPGSWKHSIA